MNDRCAPGDAEVVGAGADADAVADVVDAQPVDREVGVGEGQARRVVERRPRRRLRVGADDAAPEPAAAARRRRTTPASCRSGARGRRARRPRRRPGRRWCSGRCWKPLHRVGRAVGRSGTARPVERPGARRRRRRRPAPAGAAPRRRAPNASGQRHADGAASRSVVSSIAAPRTRLPRLAKQTFSRTGGSPPGRGHTDADLGGGGGNRTHVRGFAGPCLNHSATPPEPPRLSGPGSRPRL